MLAEALEHLVRGIVRHPDDVVVDDKQLRRGSVLEVRVHPEDLGKVIGRGGRTATALRTAEEKKSKAERFNEALKEAGSEPQADAVTTKKSAAKPDAKKAAGPEADDKKADEKPADEKPAEPEAVVEKPADDKPAES